MEIVLTFFTNKGNKVLISPYKDTLFGHINHQWSYDRKDKEWTSFTPRLSRIELTIENLNKYFDKLENQKE
jgi:hypothetical protein